MKDYDYVKSERYTQWGMEPTYYLFHVSARAKNILENRLCAHRETGRFQYIIAEGTRFCLNNQLQKLKTENLNG